jgi:hypothetical protein
MEKNKIQNKRGYMSLMMSWKRQVSRGTKRCLKNQNDVIRKNYWKNLRVNENE